MNSEVAALESEVREYKLQVMSYFLALCVLSIANFISLVGNSADWTAERLGKCRASKSED
jgi:hypothetical protein